LEKRGPQPQSVCFIHSWIRFEILIVKKLKWR